MNTLMTEPVLPGMNKAYGAGKEINREAMKGRAKALIDPFINALDAKYEIPEEKLEPVVSFAVDFFAKYFMTMKQDRMIRKVAEQFKLIPKIEADETDKV